MKFLSDRQFARCFRPKRRRFRRRCRRRSCRATNTCRCRRPQKQREVEARLKEMGDTLARRQGLSRRRFFQTAAGMAASFVAMNQVFGNLFDASAAEAATPEHGRRARRLAVRPVRH